MIYWRTELKGDLGMILHGAMILWRTELKGDLGMILHGAMILWRTELLGDSERYAIYDSASQCQ